MKKALFAFVGLLHASRLVAATPVEALDVVQEFLGVIVHERFENRFGLNKQDQFANPSAKLQRLAAVVECEAAQAYREEEAPYIHADSDMAFDRWDPPTSCEIVKAEAKKTSVRVEVACS